MTPYAWSCLACDASNAATSAACSRCRCPAHATSAQIASARAAHRRRIGLPAVAPLDPIALVRGLPLLPIGAAMLALPGALLLIVNLGASSTAFGGLLLALAALCISAYRPPAKAAIAG